MLLEALTAFLIAALALSGFYEGATTALAGTDAAASYDQALSRARSRLDAATGSKALISGETSGEDGGGYHYRVRIRLAQTGFDRLDDAPQAGNSRRMSLYDVTVAISWQRGRAHRSVELASEAVGPAASSP